MVKFQLTLFIMGNNMAECSGSDCKETLSTILMPVKFVEADKVGLEPYYRLGDTSVKKWITEQHISDQFILDLVSYYENQLPEMPICVIEEQEEDCNESDEQRFFACFEFTNNQEDFVSGKDLTAFFKEIKNNIDIEFESKKMRHLITIKNGKQINKRDGNYVIKGFCNLKLIPFTNSE